MYRNPVHASNMLLGTTINYNRPGSICVRKLVLCMTMRDKTHKHARSYVRDTEMYLFEHYTKTIAYQRTHTHTIVTPYNKKYVQVLADR